MKGPHSDDVLRDERVLSETTVDGSSQVQMTVDRATINVLYTDTRRSGRSDRQLATSSEQNRKTPFTRYNRLSSRLYNQFDNRLYRVNKHPNGFDNRFNNRVERTAVRSTGCQTGLSNRFDNRFDNRLYRVNGA